MLPGIADRASLGEKFEPLLSVLSKNILLILYLNEIELVVWQPEGPVVRQRDSERNSKISSDGRREVVRLLHYLGHCLIGVIDRAGLEHMDVHLNVGRGARRGILYV